MSGCYYVQDITASSSPTSNYSGSHQLTTKWPRFPLRLRFTRGISSLLFDLRLPLRATPAGYFGQHYPGSGPKALHFPRYLLVELGDCLILQGKLQSRHGEMSKAISDSSKCLKVARFKDAKIVSSRCCPEAAGLVSWWSSGKRSGTARNCRFHTTQSWKKRIFCRTLGNNEFGAQWNMKIGNSDISIGNSDISIGKSGVFVVVRVCIQLPSGDCEMTFARWSDGYPDHIITFSRPLWA